MNIPSTAVTGITKMRVGMISSSSLVPVECPNVSVYGEYEDYCVYIGSDSGINENTDNDVIQIYPNPVTSLLNIATDKNIENIQIQSIDGKVLRNIDYSEKTIDVSELPIGIYLIQVKTLSLTYTLKFVKK